MKVPFLHKLKMLPNCRSGNKIYLLTDFKLHAVPPDCLQSMEELVTIWPASNCLQRETADTEEAGKIGNFNTQPSWPQEKLHAAVDAVCLPIPQHQDTVQTCVTCLHTQGIPQTKPGLRTSSGHKAILHSLDWPGRYWPTFSREFMLHNWPCLF